MCIYIHTWNFLLRTQTQMLLLILLHNLYYYGSKFGIDIVAPLKQHQGEKRSKPELEHPPVYPWGSQEGSSQFQQSAHILSCVSVDLMKSNNPSPLSLFCSLQTAEGYICLFSCYTLHFASTTAICKHWLSAWLTLMTTPGRTVTWKCGWWEHWV